MVVLKDVLDFFEVSDYRGSTVDVQASSRLNYLQIPSLSS